MKLVTAVAALVTFAATPALAEEQQPERRFQVSPYVGAFIPTGDQGDLFDDALLTGMTLSVDLHRYFAVVGSFGWAGSEGKRSLMLDEDVDLYTYDVGFQGHYPLALGKGLTLKPFVGAGLGARTYEVDVAGAESETDFVNYFSLGANLEYRQFALGLTVRDNLSVYDGIGQEEEDSSTHNDLFVFASVGARF